ncbi:hypothetical protein B0H15DRAFT_281507 [Mycena belliarum]|uniref:phytol kinase n=1 Tax=Mycena belliarum TaxID=1033014 RepID=A0AAD6XPC5_9AGAR|nr:hypothetical protein B0H15DRAFT_281507 [Mycena belliae]
MHDAFKVSNLSKLPPRLRAVAKRAADGSSDDLRNLALVHMNNGPAFEQTLLLPVVFTQLERAAIPTPDELDVILCGANPSSKLQQVTAVTRCLDLFQLLLRRNVVPTTAYADAWSRLYPWIIFIETYTEVLPRDVKPSADIHDIFLQIILVLDSDPATSQLLKAAHGVRLILARNWAMALRSGALATRSAQSDQWHDVGAVLNFLTADATAGDHMDEILAGIGGGRAELAALLVDQLDLALLTEWDVWNLLARIVRFIDVADDGRGVYRHALLACGVVRSQLDTLRLLLAQQAAMSREQFAPLIHLTLSSMMNNFRVPAGHLAIAQGLDAGLLRVIVAMGALPDVPTSTVGNFIPDLEELLEKFIPATLVYYPVVLQMEHSFADVLPDVATPQFEQCPLYPLWTRFSTFTQQRLDALEFFVSRAWVSSKACENMECLKIAEKRHFKRCSGCSMVYYCSWACQHTDWNAGHRDWCRTLTADGFSGPSRPRDRAFLRALLEYNFRFLAKGAVLVQQAAFIHAHPGVEPLTVFDLTQLGELNQLGDNVSVHPAALFAKLHDVPMRRAQAARSGRRMQLHVVMMSGGGVAADGTPLPLMRMLPMWSGSARLLDGVLGVVAALPRGTKFAAVYPQVVVQLKILAEAPQVEIY